MDLNQIAGVAAAVASIFWAAPGTGRTMLPDSALLRGEVVLSGDWAFACNNRGLCTGIGVPDARPALDPELAILPPVVVRIEIGKGSGTEKSAWLHLPKNIEELSGFKLGASAGSGDSGPAGLLVPEEQVDALFQELGRQTPHIVHDTQTGKAVARLPQHGFEWGYAAVQRVQSQFDVTTPTSVDPSIRPDNAVSIQALESAPASALPSVTVAQCSGPSADIIAKRHLLSDGTRLWQYVCAFDGGVDGPSLLFSQKDSKAPLVPLVLPDPAGTPIDAGQVWLRDASLTSGILLVSSAYEGTGKDCGRYWIWVLTRDGFRLIAKRDMPKCGTGLSEGLWLDTYDASFLDDLDLLQKNGASER